MVRLTSDMMTGYTHQDWEDFRQGDVRRRMEQSFRLLVKRQEQMMYGYLFSFEIYCSC